MKTLKIRASGGIGIGIPLLFLITAGGLIAAGFSEKDGWLGGLLLGVPVICVALYYYLNHYIILNDQEFIAKFVMGRGGKRRSLEKTFTRRVSVNNIRLITLGTVRWYKEHGDEFRNNEVDKMIGYHQSPTGMIPGGGLTAFLASRFTPIFTLWLKEGRESISVPTKFFSKNSFRRLLMEFQKRGIKVVTDPSLKL